MSHKKMSWIQTMSDHFVTVKAETEQTLGKDNANYFVDVANDCIEVTHAVNIAYPEERGIVLYAVTGFHKEVDWLRFLFLAGNYPYVLARLRHLWECVFRAYWAECNNPPSPGQSSDDSRADQLVWLDEQEGNLTWGRYIQEVLKAVHPLAKEKAEVRTYYHDRWRYLNQHVHPSAHLSVRLADTGQILTDCFDEEWAAETLAAARDVFDLVWLAVLHRYPKAADNVEKLWGEYPTLRGIIKSKRKTS
jgi:hypothetical protein